ncbi:TBC1 domain family member 13 isoform X1 [Drosophila ficusphila]|uniref:TBC1 domain family member 13 isoform X1 n=1 Tax=Drosophila ficusphila TaxID=30025 RepID=UPI0007E7B9CB|nr:TBC1 domain family member 13 isoform X1 [Drosophila ficusphila]
MSIFKARVKEFEDVLSPPQDVIDLKELRRLAFSGVPDVQSFRALSWKILLGYLGPRRSSWTSTLAQKRALYKQFIEELVLPPGHSINGDEAAGGDGDKVDSGGVGLQDHPLSEGPESAWNTFFNDNEFLLQIDKDVRRLCPDISFFQQPTEYPCEIVVHSKGEHGRRLHERVVPAVLSSANVERKGLGMTKQQINLITKRSVENYAAMEEGQEAHWEVVQRILFIYAKLNPGQGYVQGMNEIVGPIYYVMASDPDLSYRAHAEADCFFCFTALMSEIRDFFIKTLDDAEGGIKFMMARLSNMLKSKDLNIYELLKSQELHPQYYSFRWLTLLLSQEFPLPDVLRIWDSVFADEQRFDFLIKICCSMILIQREAILENDFASNVKLLQNYPPIDINVVITHARSLA